MMIRIKQETKDNFTVYIKKNFERIEILNLLSMQGYEIKTYLWKYEDETFPFGTTYHEVWTFTATKGDEPQSEDNIFTAVFKKEIEKAFKQLLKVV